MADRRDCWGGDDHLRPGVLIPVYRATHSGEWAGACGATASKLVRDPNEEYFADGMTDALITELAHTPNLRVVSRTSVMQDKGKKKPLRHIASELGVDAVLEGSIVRSSDRVRITAQLIDVRDDRHLWAQSYEEPIKLLIFG